MSEPFDVVIGGGAVMGSSIAYHLAAHPDFSGRILVIDRDMTYRQAASSLSLSSVRQQFSSPINIRVGLYGVAFLRKAGELLAVDGEAPDLPLTENGYLYLAGEAGASILTANHATQLAEGADILLLGHDALKTRFPFLNLDGIAMAAWGRSGEGWFDGYTLMQAFRRKARALGVVYRESEIAAVERDGARISAVRLANGERIVCGAFVNAAGASGAAELARQMGFEIPVHARKRCVFQFNARERIAHCPLIIDASGAYVRSEGESYLCGISPPEAEDPDSDDFDVIWPQFDDIIWPALAHRIPAFENIRPGRAWAGHYDLNVFDHNAIVGRAPGLDNAYLASGFSGHGIQQSPAVGRGLAELIAQGRYATLDLADFAFERIAAGRPLIERNVI
ncbi:FAD-binding oxidoreductase [Methylocapsa sp. S129]|uniref:NAD(P)/FAD-dependent oxidoreductase n=1 Tax=Methylocapsa sp. S129 TaxID=1641869 RepID=UPI00131B2C81|nr:FAD-binding oxidoreductase [Methylocapsa sp. S129]